MSYLQRAYLHTLKSGQSEKLASTNFSERTPLFLGLVSYYRCFIPNLTVIAKCLHQLVGPTHTKKDKRPWKCLSKTYSCGEMNIGGIQSPKSSSYQYFSIGLSRFQSSIKTKNGCFIGRDGHSVIPKG